MEEVHLHSEQHLISIGIDPGLLCAQLPLHDQLRLAVEHDRPLTVGIIRSSLPLLAEEEGGVLNLLTTPINSVQDSKGYLVRAVFRYVSFWCGRTPAQERRACLRFRFSDHRMEVAFERGVDLVWSVPRIAPCRWLGLSCSTNINADIILQTYPITQVPSIAQITAAVGEPFRLETYYTLDAGQFVDLNMWWIDNDGNDFPDHVTVIPAHVGGLAGHLNDSGDYVHVPALDDLSWNRGTEVFALRARADWKQPLCWEDVESWRKVSAFLNRILAEGEPDLFHKVWRLHAAIERNEMASKTLSVMLDIMRTFLYDSDPNDRLSDGYHAANLLNQQVIRLNMRV